MSLMRMFLSLDPLAKTLFEFQAMAPTLAVWPRQVIILRCLTQSHSCTSPVWVPTPKTLDEGLEEQLVTRSLEDSSTSLTTLELPAFQRQTLLLRPTANRLEADQSMRLRQKSSQRAGASSTLVGTLLIFLSLIFLVGMYQSGKIEKPLLKRCLQSFQLLLSSLQLRQQYLYLYLRKFSLEKVQMSGSLKRWPSPRTPILQTSFTVRPLLSLLFSLWSSFSSSSIHSTWSLKRSLAEQGIFRTGKKRSAMYFIDFSRFSSVPEMDISQREQIFLLDKA